MILAALSAPSAGSPLRRRPTADGPAASHTATRRPAARAATSPPRATRRKASAATARTGVPVSGPAVDPLGTIQLPDKADLVEKRDEKDGVGNPGLGRRSVLRVRAHQRSTVSTSERVTRQIAAADSQSFAADRQDAVDCHKSRQSSACSSARPCAHLFDLSPATALSKPRRPDSMSRGAVRRHSSRWARNQSRVVAQDYTIVEIDPADLGGTAITATGMNNLGHVVGSFIASNDQGASPTCHADPWHLV